MSEFVSETAKKAGDRDLTKFEVMQIHAEYWQWSNKEIAALRRQVADAKEENERVRQANLHTMDVFEDMKAAKEKAEARVAELEAEALYLRARDDSLVDFLCNESGVDIVSIKAACGHIPAEDSWLLRKQAEAVDWAWHKYCRESVSEDCKVLYQGDMEDAVKALRQQVAALERQSEGGE